MKSHSDPHRSTTQDRRRGNRDQAEGRVEITLQTTQMEGLADNISKSGILFFTEGDLRVQVEIEEKGEKKILEGQLVRCERIQGDRRGWAVEFDRP